MEQEDIKPDVTDSELVEEQVGEALENLFEAEGETDAVANADATPVLSLTDFETLAGRKFDSIDDAKKHYVNLKSFVGKKTEPKTEAPSVEKHDGTEDIRKEINELKATLVEKDFVADHPEAKEHLSIIRAVAKDRGVSLADAYKDEQVSNLIVAAASQKKEREVGVNSKNRVSPAQSQRINKLAENARSGKSADQEALVAEMLGLK